MYTSHAADCGGSDFEERIPFGCGPHERLTKSKKKTTESIKISRHNILLRFLVFL